MFSILFFVTTFNDVLIPVSVSEISHSLYQSAVVCCITFTVVFYDNIHIDISALTYFDLVNMQALPFYSLIDVYLSQYVSRYQV